MSKKKSLGHNPLAYSMRSHASLDFIGKAPDQQPGEGDKKKEKAKKPQLKQKEKQKPEKGAGRKKSAVKKQKPAAETGHTAGKKKPNKTVVSYYLEEPLVDKIRAMAEAENTSYSALAHRLLKKGLPED